MNKIDEISDYLKFFNKHLMHDNKTISSMVRALGLLEQLRPYVELAEILAEHTHIINGVYEFDTKSYAEEGERILNLMKQIKEQQP